MPVLTYGPEKRYATALFELAVQEKLLPTVADTAARLGHALAHMPQLSAYLESKVVSSAEKVDALQAVLKTLEAGALMEKFIRFVGAENRLEMLAGILFHVVEMADEQAGKVKAQVASAQALTEDQRAKIIKIVEGLAPQAKAVELKESVDASLMAGVRLQVGSCAWDNTLKSRLEDLKSHLAE